MFLNPPSLSTEKCALLIYCINCKYFGCTRFHHLCFLFGLYRPAGIFTVTLANFMTYIIKVLSNLKRDFALQREPQVQMSFKTGSE